MLRNVVLDIEEYRNKDWYQSWTEIANELTVDLLGFYHGKLVIGADDTVVPGYDGGPCRGMEPMIEIESLANLLIERAREVDQAVSGTDTPDAKDDLIGAADYLDAEANKIREYIARAYPDTEQG